MNLTALPLPHLLICLVRNVHHAHEKPRKIISRPFHFEDKKPNDIPSGPKRELKFYPKEAFYTIFYKNWVYNLHPCSTQVEFVRR